MFDDGRLTERDDLLLRAACRSPRRNVGDGVSWRGFNAAGSTIIGAGESKGEHVLSICTGAGDD